MWGVWEGGREGRWESVLLKAVKWTDKEISFVTLSGRGKKKERESDLKMFSRPVIRGERGRERERKRHLKMFPGFLFHEYREKGGARHHRRGWTSLIIWEKKSGLSADEVKGKTVTERVYADSLSLSQSFCYQSWDFLGEAYHYSFFLLVSEDRDQSVC